MSVKAICIEINTDPTQGLGEHSFYIEPHKGDYVQIGSKLYHVVGSAIAAEGMDLFLREVGNTTDVINELREELEA